MSTSLDGMDGADPDQLVLLTTARTEIEGRALASRLEGEGIRVEVFAAAANMVQWDGGYGNNVKVMVRRGDVARAREAAAGTARAGAWVDWDRVDVGEMEEGAVPAPRREGPRVGGMSPWLWRVRMVGLALMNTVMMLAAGGERLAVPAAIIGVILVASAFSDRRSTDRNSVRVHAVGQMTRDPGS